MTRADLVDWLQVHGCMPVPIEGINVTGNQIKFINPKFNNAYAYIDTPINDKDIPDYFVCHICNNLYIPLPDTVKEQDHTYKKIKENFNDKGKKKH